MRWRGAMRVSTTAIFRRDYARCIPNSSAAFAQFPMLSGRGVKTYSRIPLRHERARVMPRPRGMDRRHFILVLSAGAALLGAAPARAECGGPSAIEFVEDLYQKQARLMAENAPLSQEDFLELFSRGMR